MVKRFILFLLIFFYLSFWAILSPPFQAPDEFSHTTRMLAISNNFWFADRDDTVLIDSEIYNPLLEFRIFHSIPFNIANKLNRKKAVKAKRMRWRDMGENIKVRVRSQSSSYPVLYYTLVYFISMPIIDILSATPYQAFYIYRLSSVFYVSLLWYVLIIYLPLMIKDVWIRRPLLFFIFLMPSFAFISSSINCESFVIPLTSLSIIFSYLYLAVSKSRGFLIRLFIVLLATLFTKANGVVLVFTLVLVSLLGYKFSWRRRVILCCLSCISFLISYFSYYIYARPKLYSAILYRPENNINLFQYIVKIPERMDLWYKGFYGILGWQDVFLKDFWYYVLLFFIFCNFFLSLIFASRGRGSDRGGILYSFFIFIVYSLGLLAIDFIYYYKHGPILLGRNFLPVVLGVSFLMLHSFRSVKLATIIFMVIFNLAMVKRTVDRYYWHYKKNIIYYIPFIKP